MKNKRLKRSKFLKKYLPLTIIVLLVTGFLLYSKSRGETTEMSFGAKTTSDIESAQSDFNGGTAEGGNKSSDNTTSEDQGTAVITDTGGIASSNTNSPRKSNTGEITVYQPLNNMLVKSGQEISGTSTLPSIQYRLIDSESGVIATGSLKVVNGNFSGTLSFSTNANEGRLDIFAIRADASEYSVIEIPVRYST